MLVSGQRNSAEWADHAELSAVMVGETLTIKVSSQSVCVGRHENRCAAQA
ncbi:hypothetical protein [Neokomagataea tanensis]|nr:MULTISPECIES: hypothetical protein [Neokomagataea]